MKVLCERADADCPLYPRQLPFPLFYLCDICFLLSADGKEESLLGKRRELTREVANLKETYERLVSRFPNLRFDYK